MRAHISGWLLFVLLVILAIGGCSDGFPKRLPVEGMVVYEGTDEPVPEAAIILHPQDIEIRNSEGQTDQEGHFALYTFGSLADPDGATLGKHKVTIVAAESLNAEMLGDDVEGAVDPSQERFRFFVQPEYMMPETTPLTVTVEKGMEQPMRIEVPKANF